MLTSHWQWRESLFPTRKSRFFLCSKVVCPYSLYWRAHWSYFQVLWEILLNYSVFRMIDELIWWGYLFVIGYNEEFNEYDIVLKTGFLVEEFYWRDIKSVSLLLQKYVTFSLRTVVQNKNLVVKWCTLLVFNETIDDVS